ncbi:hypothetical protein DBR17_04655 [Sphingomonas sp. HMWF008]|nr:hypothetical protein DBR17_04655 [Sphingomonas sp. HMWF008]
MLRRDQGAEPSLFVTAAVAIQRYPRPIKEPFDCFTPTQLCEMGRAGVACEVIVGEGHYRDFTLKQERRNIVSAMLFFRIY